MLMLNLDVKSGHILILDMLNLDILWYDSLQSLRKYTITLKMLKI